MRMMVHFAALVMFASSVCAVGGDKPNASTERASAKAVADSYMSDLVANQIGKALDRMDPGFVASTGSRTDAEKAIVKLFDYCGRPLDSEFKHDETGFKLYANGRKKPMRKFYYAATTDQHPKGVCFFAVEVVQGDKGGFQVTTFGPLKVVSGQLPEFLR